MPSLALPLTLPYSSSRAFSTFPSKSSFIEQQRHDQLHPHDCRGLSEVGIIQAPLVRIFGKKQSSDWRRCCSSSSAHGDELEEPPGGKGFDFEQEMANALDDEESRALLQDLAAATERVAAARRELDLISEQERRLAELNAQLELLNATQAAANEFVTDREKEVAAAEAEVAAAEIALVRARAGESYETSSNRAKTKVDENLERINSIQAASVAALGGVSASLPFAIASGHGLDLNFVLSEGSIFISCALFGVCFRYIVRRDLDNIQLKTGAAAAFGVIRGLGQIETTQLLADCSRDGCDEVLRATLNAGQSLFIFFAVALVLDYCFKIGLLRPFSS